MKFTIVYQQKLILLNEVLHCTSFNFSRILQSKNLKSSWVKHKTNLWMSKTQYGN